MAFSYLLLLKVMPGRKEDKGSIFFLAFGVFAVCLLSFLEWYFTGKGFTTLSYIGALLVAMGFAVRWSGEYSLGRRHKARDIIKNHKLVTYGIFSHIRHPCYSGAFLILLGIAMFFLSKWGFLALVTIIIPTGIYRINMEEKALQEHFGKVYREYCKKTKKLIPKIY